MLNFSDCETIRRWLTKCADDSETANYISAHTKDCPKCNICIEKNGGCNHMQCYNCKHDFCWMCLGDWRTHGSEYYECSRYVIIIKTSVNDLIFPWSLDTRRIQILQMSQPMHRLEKP